MSEQRRLAAILVADVVGYSKLVGRDEAGTLAQLRALQTEVIEPAIAKHAGRLFKAVGDGFLVEFASAVQAVEAAQAIQQANADGKLPLRIGIHVGDVVVQGEDLMGDGVNIAARIGASPMRVALPSHDRSMIRCAIELDMRSRQGRNRAKEHRAAGARFLVRRHKGRWCAAPALALPDKPSIAVLPFQNMSGDPEQEYFADGMVEDIITALSRFKSLFVIARNSLPTKASHSTSGRWAANWACAMSSRAACVKPATACASQASSLKPKAAAMFGLNSTMVISTTSSRCRTASPHQ